MTRGGLFTILSSLFGTSQPCCVVSILFFRHCGSWKCFEIKCKLPDQNLAINQPQSVYTLLQYSANSLTPRQSLKREKYQVKWGHFTNPMGDRTISHKNGPDVVSVLSCKPRTNSYETKFNKLFSILFSRSFIKKISLCHTFTLVYKMELLPWLVWLWPPWDEWDCIYHSNCSSFSWPYKHLRQSWFCAACALWLWKDVYKIT